MKNHLVYIKKIQSILLKRGKWKFSKRWDARKGLKVKTIVIPEESACGGRDPVSSYEWFCWIPDSRCAPSGMTASDKWIDWGILGFL
jgi:hypothetical protein